MLSRRVGLHHSPDASSPLARDGAAILLGVSETAVRLYRRGGIVAVAVAMNAVLFAVGVYFELHPHDRHDLWSAAGVAAVALLNSGALTLPATAPSSARLVLRLRRIALIANTLLLLTAALIVALETLLDGRHATLHGAALVVPPLLTIAALRRLPPPA